MGLDMENARSFWKCECCKAEYDTTALIALDHIPAKEGDPDPKKNYGYTAVCVCEYVFHKDKTVMRETIDVKTPTGEVVKASVSTVYLELNHWGMWYETMIFFESEEYGYEISSDYQSRYETLDEAMSGHQKLVDLIKAKKFSLKTVKWELELDKEAELK